MKEKVASEELLQDVYFHKKIYIYQILSVIFLVYILN